MKDKFFAFKPSAGANAILEKLNYSNSSSDASPMTNTGHMSKMTFLTNRLKYADPARKRKLTRHKYLEPLS